ncbi:MAG: hypothetical protein KGI08_09960 [Thaumarchaeota archaeon]|nr:hypothetical protein [Nitrososphaerota archaeon]
MKEYENPNWHGGLPPLHKFKGVAMTERKTQSLEDLMQRPDGYVPEDAERDFDQLGRMLMLLFTLDTGDYPLSYYSSGEKKTKKIFNRKTGETEVSETLVSLPIWKEPNTIEKGLRFNLTSAIFSRVTELRNMGMGKEADDMVRLKRAYERKP